MNSIPRYTSRADGWRRSEEIASLRSATPARRGQKSPRIARAVANGIVCFCGERFSDRQALEFMLHLRAEVGSDLAILKRRRDYSREYQQRPEQRAKQHKAWLARKAAMTADDRRSRAERERQRYQARRSAATSVEVEELNARNRAARRRAAAREGRQIRPFLPSDVFVEIVRERGCVTPRQMSELLGISAEAARQRLSKYKQLGLLTKVRHGTYSVKKASS